MKRIFLLLLQVIVLLMGIGICHAEESVFTPPAGFDARKDDVVYGKLEFQEYPSAACGNVRKCLVVLPPSYTPEKQYPVLFLLHGIGGTETEWMGGKPDVILGNLAAKGEAPEMITVLANVKALKAGETVPNMYSPQAFAAFDFFINDLRDSLLPFIREKYSTLEGREHTAIAGLSMGGREALYIGLTMPETFGYVGAFCPAPGVLPYFAEGGLFRKEDFCAAPGLETFILINAGATDGVVGEWPKTYSDTLAANGTEHVFYVTAGGHDFTVWKHGLYNFAKHIFQTK